MDHPTPQVSAWAGEFGQRYTDRNQTDPTNLLPAFRAMLGDLKPRRILEVGCNRGHNLAALEQLFPEAQLVGIEPNRYAISIARQSGKTFAVLEGNAFELPFKDGYFDLVYTAGVLIHIAPQDLGRATAEIHRVSGRNILCAEYYAEQETVIPYHGHSNLLWKRDFRRHYLESYPDLREVRQGYLNDAWWDDMTWWVFEKTGRSSGR